MDKKKIYYNNYYNKHKYNKEWSEKGRKRSKEYYDSHKELISKRNKERYKQKKLMKDQPPPPEPEPEQNKDKIIILIFD